MNDSELKGVEIYRENDGLISVLRHNIFGLL